MRRESEHHRESGQHHEREADARRDARRVQSARIAPPGGVDRRAGAPEREEQRRAERGRAEIARAHGAVRCAGVAPVFGAV